MSCALSGKIKYLLDEQVDEVLDKRLRELLCACFSDPCFRKGRYYREVPRHRWMVWEEGEMGERLVGHLAMHEKAVRIRETRYLVGGIAEVCVHPDLRGKGWVKALVEEVIRWTDGKGMTFLVLFGKTEVYRSSGFATVKNLFTEKEGDEGKVIEGTTGAMVRAVAGSDWPHEEPVFLLGNGF